jgi:hypothetical protein
MAYRRYQGCLLARESDKNAQRNECEPLIIAARASVQPEFDSVCAQTRLITPGNGMRSFDPAAHVSMFWFTPMGTAWKRAAHGAPVQPAALCGPIARAAVACASDFSASNARCRELSHRALACRAGVACPDSQEQLLQCVSAADARGDEGPATAGNARRALEACLGKIEGFTRCNIADSVTRATPTP